MSEPIVIEDFDIRAVILNISRQYEPGLEQDQLYERTRGYWVMQPHDHSEAEFAIAIANRVIREVYRISDWTRQLASEIEPNPLRRLDPASRVGLSSYRWSFTGVPASEDIRKKYIGREIKSQAQNPVRWVNC